MTLGQLTNADEGVWGMYSPIQFFEFYKTAAQNGCGVFGVDGAVTIDQPGCVEALEFMVGAQEEGIQPSDADLAGIPNEDLFAQGKLAMLTSGIWMFPKFFANAAVVSAETEHPDEAWAWASFFTSSPEATQIRVAASWELPALNDQALFDEWLAITPPESREVVFEALETLVTPPVIEDQAQLQDAINAQIELVKLGSSSPEEALAQARTDVEGPVDG